MYKVNAKATFEVTWTFEDGTVKTIKTDEWNEPILRKRFDEAGMKIVDEKRIQIR